MSEPLSRQKRDEEVRDLESAKNRLELKFRKEQSAAQAQNQEWEKKKQEIDVEKEKVEERLRGFLAHVENQTAIDRAPDSAVVERHRRKLEGLIAEQKTKRADIEAQQGSDMRTYLEDLDKSNRALKTAHEAVLGAKELLEAEAEAEAAAKAAETPPTPAPAPAPSP